MKTKSRDKARLSPKQKSRDKARLIDV